jgi:hypothetical protein
MADVTPKREGRKSRTRRRDRWAPSMVDFGPENRPQRRLQRRISERVINPQREVIHIFPWRRLLEERTREEMDVARQHSHMPRSRSP